MLEEYLIGNCSPTLASLKTANLFSMPYESEEELLSQIAYWNEEMKEKGISVVLLISLHVILLFSVTIS